MGVPPTRPIFFCARSVEAVSGREWYQTDRGLTGILLRGLRGHLGRRRDERKGRKGAEATECLTVVEGGGGRKLSSLSFLPFSANLTRALDCRPHWTGFSCPSPALSRSYTQHGFVEQTMVYTCRSHPYLIRMSHLTTLGLYFPISDFCFQTPPDGFRTSPRKYFSRRS